MSKINDIVEKMQLSFHTDRRLEQTLYSDLVKIATHGLNQNMGSDEGYCFAFNLPMSAVNKLFSLLDLDQAEVEEAFRIDWKYPKGTKMYSDSYYHILFLITIYGIKNNNKKLSEYALLIILFKIWNGRKHDFIKYCDPKIMNYVIQHMCTKRHEVTKHDGPYGLLKDYFVPTLLKKYESDIKRDASKSKRLFEQAYTRIRQLFVQNQKVNITTGKNESQGGLMQLYIKAKQEGLSISKTNVRGMGMDDEGPSFDDFTSSHERDEIINSTADYITMNSNPTYPDNFIRQLNKETKVSVKVIDKVVKSIHNHMYYELIQDMLGIILSKTKVQQKSDICNSQFTGQVKKHVISSKNNADSKKIQQMANKILTGICDMIGADFNKYSNVNQIQLRIVLITGIVYNLKKNVCRSLSL